MPTLSQPDGWTEPSREELAARDARPRNGDRVSVEGSLVRGTVVQDEIVGHPSLVVVRFDDGSRLRVSRRRLR